MSYAGAADTGSCEGRHASPSNPTGAGERAAYMLVAAEAQINAQNETLAERGGIIERKEDRIIRLEKLLADFKRALYGAQSEKGHPDQYHLALEDIETAMAVVHAEDEAIGPPKATGASKPCVGRGVLPKHLPRIEELIAPDDV